MTVPLAVTWPVPDSGQFSLVKSAVWTYIAPAKVKAVEGGAKVWALALVARAMADRRMAVFMRGCTLLDSL